MTSAVAAPPLVRSETVVRPRRLVRAWAVVRLTRPWFWPLGWGGGAFGAVLASGDWLPAAPAMAGTVAVGLVLGPFLWGFVFALNDLHDLPTDRRNPRKATAPLVTGVLTPADLRRCAGWCAAGALVAAAVAGPVLLAGTAAVLVLGWLYSVPPVRLKARPGWDVTVNAVTVGVLGPLGGWALHRPVLDYPPVLVVLGVLLGGALYLPTTVIDRAADRAAGCATAAVRWNAAACYRAGLAAWVLANAVWLACCHLGVLVARDGWLLQTITIPALVAVYAYLTRRPSIVRLAVVALAFAVPATDFLVAYTRAG
ncbi:UbiA family prenyltransferase [Asanoa sp. WMMD1127]|uniref:UbiA family prenyltransferase n=1 Tax=Asanoa sp. WMMD1127 TaxID=3016107 RepID=UPI0024173826|nr:UbiA family prenyltransferase [Asanoa sp. WMMD1127]MDG4827668.1 UbiA family prenyltransferase [Asanoa sp. WMMD1127]